MRPAELRAPEQRPRRRPRRTSASRSSRRAARSDQTGSSCRQSTSGRSSVASRTISSRKPRRSGGLALPWKTFQVRTSSAHGRASVGRCLRRQPLRRGDLAAARPLRPRQAASSSRPATRPSARTSGPSATRPRSDSATTRSSSRRARRSWPTCATTSHRRSTRRPAEEYEAEFNRAVAKRLPRFALEIENR